MDEASWRRLLETLEVRHKIHPATEDQLAAYERETSFPLPASYRSYCRVFGAGDVGDWYQIAIPGFTRTAKRYDKALYNLAAKTAFYHQGRDWQAYSSLPDQFERAVIFGDDCTGAVYFWAPWEETVPQEHEYAIYVVWRDCSLERVCDTFWSFVNICLHRSDRKLYEDPPAIGFRAAWVGRK